MNDPIVGVVATGEIAVGVVRGHELTGKLRRYPPAESAEQYDDIHSMPMDAIVETVAQTIQEVCSEHGVEPSLAGVGLPGIIRAGVIEESPNLKQAKGARIGEMLMSALASHGVNIPVHVFNDADAMAAGMAATRGQLEKLIRVWTLGQGVGFGRYPHAEGVWEGGHCVVTLDPKETFCCCGGRGHVEGIMGHRAMRLRFLDLEPEEIFQNAAAGDPRCCEFELLWHRALAAASATSIHLEGPGKFFISGPNSRFVKINLLSRYLHEMVTMTPLQGSVFEVVPMSTEIAVVGAAVNAGRVKRNL
ncbi:MAG: ROK family protein [Acidobacteriota bacterium]|nr:ROK family protein [Acidobacteriota bacterium]